MSKTQTTQPTIIDLKLESFQSQVIDDPSPILIDFWAPWCGPCRMMTPILHETVGLLAGTSRVAKINVDEEQALAEAFGVRGIPTLVLMRAGKVVNSFSGVVPAAKLADWVKGQLK